VATADVADGLDEGGGCQTEAQGHMQDMVRPGGPAQRGAHAEEHEEHGPPELCEDRPPKIHGPELPHCDACFLPTEQEKGSKKQMLICQGESKKNSFSCPLFLHFLKCKIKKQNKKIKKMISLLVDQRRRNPLPSRELGW
jgi:hypothetical protein